jgi:hypothetical protein
LNNREDDDLYSELFEDLNEFEINDSEKMRALIGKHLHAALVREARNVASSQRQLERNGFFLGNTPDRIKRGVFFTHVGLVRTMLSSEFGDRWGDWNDRKFRERGYL